MTNFKKAARAFFVLFLGLVTLGVAPKALAAEDCVVSFLIANDKDASWQNETSATDGDSVNFYLDICHRSEDEAAVTVRVDLPSEAEGKVTATLTAKIGGETQTRQTFLNLASRSQITYVNNSTRVTGDFDGDGTKEHNEAVWANGIFNGELGLGTLAPCHSAQLSFTVKVDAKEAGRPELIVDKKVSWRTEDYRDFLPREDHTFDVLQKVYFHLEVRNNGDRAAENVRLVDHLPEYLRWFEDQNVGELAFNVGTLEPGQSKGYDFVAIVTPDLPLGIRKVINHVRVYEGELEKGEDYASVWIRRLEEPQVKGEETPVVPDLPKAGFGPGTGGVASLPSAGAVGQLGGEAARAVAQATRSFNPEWIWVISLALSALCFAYAGYAYGKNRA